MMTNNTTTVQEGNSSLPGITESKPAAAKAASATGTPVSKIEASIAEHARPLLMEACKQSCRNAGWPESMVTKDLVDLLTASLAEELGVTAKRIERAVSRCSQPQHILRVLRAGATARKKSQREGA